MLYEHEIIQTLKDAIWYLKEHKQKFGDQLHLWEHGNIEDTIANIEEMMEEITDGSMGRSICKRPCLHAGYLNEEYEAGVLKLTEQAEDVFLDVANNTSLKPYKWRNL